MSNNRYPNAFKVISKKNISGDPIYGETEDVTIVDDYGSLQSGSLKNEDTADTYDWTIFFDNSIVADSKITTSCVVEVYDFDENLITGLVRRYSNHEMGKQIWFNEINS